MAHSVLALSQEEFKTELSEALVLIDRHLAQGGVQIRVRPLEAATDYIKFFTTAVEVRGEISFTDNDDPRNWFNIDRLNSVWDIDWSKELYVEVSVGIRSAIPDHIVEGDKAVDWVVGLPNLTKTDLLHENIADRVSMIAVNLRTISFTSMMKSPLKPTNEIVTN